MKAGGETIQYLYNYNIYTFMRALMAAFLTLADLSLVKAAMHTSCKRVHISIQYWFTIT